MTLRRLLIGLALTLYFFSTLWLTFGVPFVFTSPDESANFTFARALHEHGTLAIRDSMSASLHGALHPRSVVAVGEWLLPGSFLGLPFVAGMFAHAVGNAGMQYLTPLLLICALLAWYDVLRRVFRDNRLAMLATVLFALHPAVWYYAARSMMHNVGFVCLLVLAAWCVFAAPLSRRFSRVQHVTRARLTESLAGGLLLGLALTFRLSEALWVGVTVIVLSVIWRASWRQKIIPLVFFGLGCLLPLAGLGYINSTLYGSSFSSGYTVEDVAPVAISEGADVAVAQPEENAVLSLLLPFGFHEKAMLKNVWHFGIALFPLLSVFAAAGIFLSLREKEERPWRLLVCYTLGLAVWLGIVYGSWSFNDNPDPTAITIGDSHVRYWLPLFVLSTVFAARAILALANQSARKLMSVVVITSCVAILSVVVVFGGDDGLLRTRRVLFESAEKRSVILSATESNAIVVVDRADKFVWPYRHVLQPLRSETTYAVLPEAVTITPLYYFGIPFLPTDLEHLNSVKLAELGLRIEMVRYVGDEALYRITPR